ncbi:ATP-binding cassette domain-containing protein, partial [Nocardioides hankookensis]
MEDVSFRVAAGAKVGFLGPNGAGKTTTTTSLAGE